MSGACMDTETVLVVGPHGRHIEVPRVTQEALPDHFPLVENDSDDAKKKA